MCGLVLRRLFQTRVSGAATPVGLCSQYCPVRPVGPRGLLSTRCPRNAGVLSEGPGKTADPRPRDPSPLQWLCCHLSLPCLHTSP